jgi:uncharacterized protein YaeQ
MALTATVYNFQVQLSDVDRGVYESLAFKVARQVTETEEYFLTRVLAYCLEFTEGLTVSPALADPDEPALAVRDLTGTLTTWIDIGAPDAARLHKASKAAARVVVYTHRPPATLIRALSGERIHRVEALELYAVDRDLLAGLAEVLDRRMVFDLSVTDRHLFITLGAQTFEGPVEAITLAAPG